MEYDEYSEEAYFRNRCSRRAICSDLVDNADAITQFCEGKEQDVKTIIVAV